MKIDEIIRGKVNDEIISENNSEDEIKSEVEISQEEQEQIERISQLAKQLNISIEKAKKI